MPKAGLPLGVKMRHDSHYVDQIAARSRSIGRTIPISSIFPNPDQPRTEFGDLTDLTESIREKGVLEPLLVKPNPDGTYMIIAGERRWRSSQLAGLSELPCIELDIDEKEVAEIALIENLQRKDLTVWEEADGLAALGEKFGYTHDQIAQKISKSRSTVTEFLAIAGLPGEVRTRCNEAKIASKSTLLEVARQFDLAAMLSYLDDLQTRGNRPPAKRSEKRSVDPSESSRRPARRSVFSFDSLSSDFALEIRFAAAEHSRSDILKALKEAFDSVKAGRSEH